jgi:hypothetical protein
VNFRILNGAGTVNSTRIQQLPNSGTTVITSNLHGTQQKERQTSSPAHGFFNQTSPDFEELEHPYQDESKVPYRPKENESLTALEDREAARSHVPAALSRVPKNASSFKPLNLTNFTVVSDITVPLREIQVSKVSNFSSGRQELSSSNLTQSKTGSITTDSAESYGLFEQYYNHGSTKKQVPTVSKRKTKTGISPKKLENEVATSESNIIRESLPRNFKRFKQFDEGVSLFDIPSYEQNKKFTTAKDDIRPASKTKKPSFFPSQPSLKIREIFQMSKIADTFLTPAGRGGKSR